MDNCKEMKYIYDKENKIEIVFSNLSKKSYALHNHVSVCTIGIILQGSIILTMSDEKRQYVKDETFAIPPYVPHGILTVEPYSMISICPPESGWSRYSRCGRSPRGSRSGPYWRDSRGCRNGGRPSGPCPPGGPGKRWPWTVR